jgi:hypothetical protein
MNKDILFNIFYFLDCKDIITFSLVCKQFYDISNFEYLWKIKFTKDFKEQIKIIKLKLLTSSYKETYIKCHLIKQIINIFHNHNYYYYDIGELFDLQKLNLWDRYIPMIPKEIGTLINLKLLDFSQNIIQIIPKEIG